MHEKDAVNFFSGRTSSRKLIDIDEMAAGTGEGGRGVLNHYYLFSLGGGGQPIIVTFFPRGRREARNDYDFKE